MSVGVVLDQAKARLHAGGRVVIIDMYADHKGSFLSYFLDQFVWSWITRRGSFRASVRKLGFANAIHYLWWRLVYSLSKEGRLHISDDLSRGVPMSLDDWRRVLEESMPGGSLTPIVCSSLVFRWNSN